jgi:hypothetical protein
MQALGRNPALDHHLFGPVVVANGHHDCFHVTTAGRAALAAHLVETGEKQGVSGALAGQ